MDSVSKVEETPSSENRSSDTEQETGAKLDSETSPSPPQVVAETSIDDDDLPSNTQEDSSPVAISNAPIPLQQLTSCIDTRPLIMRSIANVNSSLERYKNGMRSWSSIKSQDDLIQLHGKSISVATAALSADEKVSAMIKINGYFMYILERFEEERESSVNSAPICIHFAENDIKMGLYTSQSMVGPGGETIDLGFSSQRLATSYPGNIMATRDELLGYILKVTKQPKGSSPERISKEKRSIVELLEWVKNYSEKGTGGNTFEQALVVVPTWFRVEHRIVLRECFHLAKFSKCYLVSEASLAAFSVLEKPLKDIPTVCMVTVGVLGVEVGMYTTTVNKTVKLVTVDKFEWELNEGDADSSGCYIACLPVMKRNKIRRAMETQEDPLRILQSTYTKAADQLEQNEQAKEQGRETYFLSESASWKEPWNKFMEQCPASLNWRALPDDWTLFTVMRLSRMGRSGKIRKVLVDHVLPLDAES